VNRKYLELGGLSIQLMGRGFAWLGIRAQDWIIDAINFVKTIEDRQGFKITNIVEVVWRINYIGDDQLWRLGNKLLKSAFGQYILGLKS